MESLLTKGLKNLAEYCNLPDEERLQTDAFIAMGWDALTEVLVRLVDISTDVDELLTDAVDTLKSTLAFQLVESISKPSPEPIFAKLFALPHALESDRDADNRVQHHQSDGVDHYSLLTDDNGLIRWSVNTIEDYRSITFQVGKPNPNAPAFIDQYLEEKRDKYITDGTYFLNGDRTEYQLTYSKRGRLPTYGTSCTVRVYKEMGDYNGKLLQENEPVDSWFDRLISDLPNPVAKVLENI